ncbi:MAG: hypothetical protein AAF074_22620 [Pseudomonadota bacterium]
MQSILVTQQGLTIRAKDEREVTNAAKLAARTDRRKLLSRDGSSLVSSSEVPFLVQSARGREFLNASLPRALARGEPAAICPASGVASGPAGAGAGPAGRGAAVEAALSACFAELRRVGAPEACGCGLIAFDRVVALPRAETTYASGTAARLKSDPPGIDGLFVARADGNGRLRLFDVTGPIAEIRDIEGDRPTLVFTSDPEAEFTGRNLPVGFRRGRIARRLYLTDASGRKISVLIGFSPEELAQYAGGWLQFPPDLARRAQSLGPSGG